AKGKNYLALRILDDRDLMIHGDLANSQRQVVLALSEHARGRHAFHLVADGHREVGWVHDDRSGVWNLFHHVAARQVALETPYTAFGLWIALGFLGLVAEFELGHAERLIVAPVDPQKVQQSDGAEKRRRLT